MTSLCNRLIQHKHCKCGAKLSNDKICEIIIHGFAYCSALSCQEKVLINDICYVNNTKLDREDVEFLKQTCKSERKAFRI